MFGRLYKKGLDFLRSNTVITRQIWGVPVHERMIPWTWDVTSLVLKRAIEEHEPAGRFSYLDMGCGHIALLGQYVKRRRPDARVVAVDLYAEFADNARANVEANGLDIEVHQSDLFTNVEGRFDLITFNLPYKPEALAPPGVAWREATFSGADGADTARRFLAAGQDYLTPAGVVLCGVNCYFLPEPLARDVITRMGWVVDHTVRRRMNTARVFVIRPAR